MRITQNKMNECFHKLGHTEYGCDDKGHSKNLNVQICDQHFQRKTTPMFFYQKGAKISK